MAMRYVGGLLSRVGNWITRSDPMSEWAIARLNMGGDKLKEPYWQNAWVYAAVRRIATNIAGVPLRLYTGSRDDPRLDESSELYRRFETPNARWTRYHLIESIVIHMNLTGNAVWLMDRERPTQVPANIWTYSQHRFEPVVVNDQLVAWKFRERGGTTRRVDPSQVLPFSFTNPYDDLWGIGPLEAARLGIEQEWRAARYNSALLDNGADPGGVITVERNIDPRNKRELRREMEERHGGYQKAGRLMFLSGGAKYDRFPVNYRDMQFIEGRKWGREEVAAVFGVPKAELSLYEDVNYATALSADKSFWQKTLIPQMRLIVAVLDAHFFPEYDGGNTWAEFDMRVIGALQPDHEKTSLIARNYRDLGVPYNEIIEVLDLPFSKQPWGDESLVPQVLMHPGEDFLSPDEPDEPDDDDAQDDDKSLGEESEIKGGPHTAEQGKAWIMREKARKRSEKRYRRNLGDYLGSVRDDLIAAIGRGKYEDVSKIPSDIFVLGKRYDKRLIKISRDCYRRLVKELGPQIEARLAKAGYMFTVTLSNPAVALFLKRKELKVVGVNKTLKAVIRSTLVRAKKEGWEMAKLVDKLDKRVASPSRALRIARTETVQAANGVEHACGVAAGVKKHQWVAAADEVTRESHLSAMALGPWPIGKMYPNGCRYPGDTSGPPGEVINCRCSVMPVE